jgi:GH35 family endo-1,4-beta-xylanase
MKWDAVEPAQGEFTFAPADAFAASQRRTVRSFDVTIWSGTINCRVGL